MGVRTLVIATALFLPIAPLPNKTGARFSADFESVWSKFICGGWRFWLHAVLDEGLSVPLSIHRRRQGILSLEMFDKHLLKCSLCCFPVSRISAWSSNNIFVLLRLRYFWLCSFYSKWWHLCSSSGLRIIFIRLLGSVWNFLKVLFCLLMGLPLLFPILSKETHPVWVVLEGIDEVVSNSWTLFLQCSPVCWVLPQKQLIKLGSICFPSLGWSEDEQSWDKLSSFSLLFSKT